MKKIIFSIIACLALLLVPVVALAGCKKSTAVAEYAVYFVETEDKIVTVKVEEGKRVAAPTTPTREGYVFVGWYSDAYYTTEFNFNQLIVCPVTAYAKWADACVVTFNSNDGTKIADQIVAKGALLQKPKNPKRIGFTFDNWYIADTTTIFNFSTPVTENITIYANFIDNDLTISSEGVITYCDRDATNVEMPVVKNGVAITSIDDYAFNDCRSLTSITIPNSVTSIGDRAFWRCSSLTSITIPESVTSIGYHAFDGCSSLTSITIPESVTSIGDSAFSGCSGLESIVVESGNTVYDSRNNCNAIIETNTNTLIAGCKNTVIPSGVVSIGQNAFYECCDLISIEIPDSVTSIGDRAFWRCSGLTELTIPDGVTSIGRNTFSGCKSLTSIEIPIQLNILERTHSMAVQLKKLLFQKKRNTILILLTK